MQKKTLPALVLVTASLFTSCVQRGRMRPVPAEIPSDALRVVAPQDCPDFIDDMDEASLRTAADRSLDYYGDLPGNTEIFFGQDVYTVSDLRSSLKKFTRLIHHYENPEERQKALCENFIVYKSTGTNPQGNVIFSAYYEHTLQARLSPDAEYHYPIYAKPPDLVENQPYYTRAEIDSQKVLDRKGLEIAWAKDPFDIYLLQVEGSGWLEIGEQNKPVRIRYAASNNQPYRSVGLTLIQKGLMSSRDISVNGIRSYLQTHPDERQTILNTNPRYVFFRLDNTREAPWALGSLLVPLTPGRSAATDPILFPRGALAWIKTQLPVFNSSGTVTGYRPFSRFVLNQDEGGAIKGPGRLDLFVGGADDATRFAGKFWQSGELYFLVGKK